MKTVKDILQELGYTKIQKSGDEYRVSVLDSSGNHLAAYAINEHTGSWYDHVAAQGGNSIESFIKLHNKIIDTGGFVETPPAKKLEGPTIFKQDSLELLFPLYNYWEGRGISAATQKFFKMGFCHSGKLCRRVVNPIIDPKSEKIVGFAGRVISDSAVPKWKIIGEKKWFVYPAYFSKDYLKDEVVLVESIGDMLALWEAGVKNSLVLFGLSLSNNLLAYLISLAPKKIYVCTNNDESKRGQVAAKKIEKKLRKFFDVGAVEVKHPPKNDFGAMKKNEIREFWGLTTALSGAE